MTKTNPTRSGPLVLLLAAATLAQADVVLFEDTFEGGNLDQWTSKPGDTHSGAIVPDPLNPTNNVLNFSAVKFGGDVFSAAPIAVNNQQRFVLSFDHLGLNNGVQNGAFLGVVPSPGADPSTFIWIASTYPSEINAPPSAATPLMADGGWRRYAIELTEVIMAGGLSSLHLALEDWAGAGSMAGDVFFDNIRVTLVEREPFDLTIFNQLVPCAGPKPGTPWKNHGQYVSTMSKTVAVFLTAGVITEGEADIVMAAAAKSNCGKPAPKVAKVVVPKAKPARR